MSSALTLGNDHDVAIDRSVEGDLYYVACYDRALSLAEVARLLADDDTAWP